MIGRTLGHYRITEKIGEGGMGEVYRAHDEHLDRDVALKVLPVGALADEDARKRFRREALTLSKLNHPHIAHVYDFDTQEGTDFLVMEFVAGDTLKEKLRTGPLPEKEISRLGAQVAEALEEAHEHGIIHRDLKPGNIALTLKGHVKVLDFGIAKLLRSQEDDAEAPTVDTVTKTVGRAGTLPYMAPEQLRGEEVDARTDIYALGATLYEAATGRRPFEGSTTEALIGDIQYRTPRPPRELNSRITEDLGRITLKCLEKDPGTRYQHANEVAVDLRRLSTTTAATIPPSPRAPAWGKPAGWLVAAGLVVIAALALLVGLDVGGVRERIFGGGAPGQITSIAVLPLENLSGDPEQDYFAAGMHDALITDLAKLGGFKRVIARSSVMRYQDTDKPLPQIARELGVEAVITGSVLRVGDQVRITAQLINASTEEHLWAERYEREMGDVLALQGEIVTAITREIKLQLTPQEQERMKSQPTVNPEAYEAYLKGRFHQQKQTAEDFDIAERYYQLALEKDPNYALAYAGLGSVWMMRGDAGFQAPSETFPKATPFFEKAMELDDSSAEMHVSLANYKNTVQWDWTGTEKEFQRALELNPNLADARFFYADMLVVLKRNEEWEREIKRARELDPLNDFKESFYGWHLNYLGRYDEAISIFQSLLSTGPNKSSNYLGLWGAYYKKGMYDEALSAARNYFSYIGEREFEDALGTGGGESAYRAAMKRVGEMMAAQSKRRHVPAIRVARMFAHSGDKDSAIQWLENAYQAKESPLIRLAVFWDWDGLRSDPRFQDLLRRLNLPKN